LLFSPTTELCEPASEPLPEPPAFVSPALSPEPPAAEDPSPEPFAPLPLAPSEPLGATGMTVLPPPAVPLEPLPEVPLEPVPLFAEPSPWPGPGSGCPY
jgi:hypothetical protein